MASSPLQKSFPDVRYYLLASFPVRSTVFCSRHIPLHLSPHLFQLLLSALTGQQSQQNVYDRGPASSQPREANLEVCRS